MYLRSIYLVGDDRQGEEHDRGTSKACAMREVCDPLKYGYFNDG